MASARDFDKDIQAMQKEIANLRDELKKSAANILPDDDFLANARAKLEEEAQKIMSGLSDMAKSAQKQGEQAIEAVEDKIAEKPMMSVLTSVGIGFVIGWLVGRK